MAVTQVASGANVLAAARFRLLGRILPAVVPRLSDAIAPTRLRDVPTPESYQFGPSFSFLRIFGG